MLPTLTAYRRGRIKGSIRLRLIQHEIYLQIDRETLIVRSSRQVRTVIQGSQGLRVAVCCSALHC